MCWAHINALPEWLELPLNWRTVTWVRHSLPGARRCCAQSEGTQIKLQQRHTSYMNEHTFAVSGMRCGLWGQKVWGMLEATYVLDFISMDHLIPPLSTFGDISAKVAASSCSRQWSLYIFFVMQLKFATTVYLTLILEILAKNMALLSQLLFKLHTVYHCKVKMYVQPSSWFETVPWRHAPSWHVISTARQARTSKTQSDRLESAEKHIILSFHKAFCLLLSSVSCLLWCLLQFGNRLFTVFALREKQRSLFCSNYQENMTFLLLQPTFVVLSCIFWQHHCGS